MKQLDFLKPPSLDAGAFDSHFAAVARTLLSSYSLLVSPPNRPAQRFKLREIEFYASTMDPFAHGTKDQDRNGGWYFHQRGSQPTLSNDEADGVDVEEGNEGQKRSFCEGTRKGLDLAFSLPELRGGILIRTIQSQSGEVVSGPSCVVETVAKILLRDHPRALEMEQGNWRGGGVVKALVEDVLLGPKNTAGLDASDPTNVLRIEARESDEVEIRRSPRVGLSLAKLPGLDVQAVRQRILLFAKTWRFTVGSASEGAKGNANTLIGMVIEQFGQNAERDRQAMVNEIVTKSGAKIQRIRDMLAEFETGYNAGLQSLGKSKLVVSDSGAPGEASDSNAGSDRPSKKRRLALPASDSSPLSQPPISDSELKAISGVLAKKSKESKGWAWCIGFCRAWGDAQSKPQS